MSLDLTSPMFEDGDDFPEKYSCDGDAVNPPLRIEGVPDDAESLVLIFDEINPKRGDRSHWVMWNISPQTTRIDEDDVPLDAIEGYNDTGNSGYTAPCPISRQETKYQFRLYVLDTDLELDDDCSRKELEKSIAGHIIDEANITLTLTR